MVKSRSDLHNHHPAEQLLEDYALGTLSAADAAWVRTHLETCAFCRAELGLLTAAAQALPFAAPDPGVELSDNVWNRIEQAILHQDAPAHVPQSEETRLTPISRASREEPSRFTSRQWLMVAALMVLSLIGGTLLGQVLPRLDGDDVQGQQIAIEFTDPNITATGELRYLPEEQVFVLNVTGMPEPPAGHVYQAWLIDAGGPIPVGVMNPQLGEFASAGDRSQFQTFAITVEPGPLGNDAPTTEPILVAQLDDGS